MTDSKLLTIKKPLRVLARECAPPSKMLYHTFTASEGSLIKTGPPVSMIYDHKDLEVAQLLNMNGEFFVILSEVEESL